MEADMVRTDPLQRHFTTDHSPLFNPQSAIAPNGESEMYSSPIVPPSECHRHQEVTQVVQRLETKASAEERKSPRKKKRRLQVRVPFVTHYDDPLDVHAQATPIETNFRHGFWATRRARVDEALVASSVSDRRLANFRECGSAMLVLQNRENGELKLTGSYCHDRMCQACQQARAQVIQQALHRRVPQHKTLHVVLTLRSTDEPLATQLTRILRCAARLRQSKFWKSRVKGGFQTLEITRNEKTGQWHPHLHALVHCEWLPQSQLCDEWQKVTGDSRITHVSLVENNAAAIREVTKYLAKPIHRSIDFDQDGLIELITALKGRHLLMTFGTWRKDPLLQELPDDDGTIWTFVATFNKLAIAAAGGDRWAKEAIAWLNSAKPGRTKNVPPPLAPDG